MKLNPLRFLFVTLMLFVCTLAAVAIYADDQYRWYIAAQSVERQTIWLDGDFGVQITGSDKDAIVKIIRE